ncbi:MAG: hypothetical protein KA120_01485 [Candidatus Goldbacteria bacterium]|nr:hypothetical protein [Candidatus Goldiibacteriota bacterium]
MKEIKSPLAPLFQRGEITCLIFPFEKGGLKGDLKEIKSPLAPLFQKGEITCLIFLLLKKGD